MDITVHMLLSQACQEAGMEVEEVELVEEGEVEVVEVDGEL